MTLKFPFSLPICAGTGKQDFRKWIDLFDRAVLACGDLSGGERLRYLGVFLEGPAYRVLRGCGVDATYDSVVAALKQTFLSPEEGRIAAVGFMGRVQTGTETIFEYAHILADLIETAYPSVPPENLDGLLRDRFLSGVLPRYQGWLRFQSCETFQAAVSCGRRAEILMQSDPANEIPDVQATVRQSATTEKGTVSMLDRQTVGDSGWRRRFFTLDGSPICLYCKRAGHVRRDCRKRLRDFGPPRDSSNNDDRCPPTTIHDIFAMVGPRKKRLRGCRGSGRGRKPDIGVLSCDVGKSITGPCVLGPVERPVNGSMFESAPSLDSLCAHMSSLRDPVLFPGSINTIITGSAVEQPDEVTLIQDGGMIPGDAKTIVPLEVHGIVIEDVVNVPDLFLESGTSDRDWMSLDDDQMSIPKVGNEYTEDMATDLARVRSWEPILGGSLIFPTGMTVLSTFLTVILCFSLVSACVPVTKGQIFVPRFRTANQIPSCREVLYFCPRLSGGSKLRQASGRRPYLWCGLNHCFCSERQTSGRKPNRWRDVNHVLWNDRQATRLDTILRKGHDNFLFSGLGCVADGRPRSAEPQHYSGVACPERCGNRIFFGGREKSETWIVSFWPINGTIFGGQWNDQRRLRRNDYDDFGMVHADNGRVYQPISDKPYLMEIGDRTSEIGDRMGWTEPWSLISFIQWSCRSINQSRVICYKGRRQEREGFHRRRETQVVSFLL
ncbi:MAG: hypothetical protein GY696_36385 [Gammaproteobacteria bacterium]|nr:hypothetical protein [Gammaproteobacteria bacterium]